MINQQQTFEKREGNLYPILPKKIYQAELADIKVDQNETYNSKMGKTTEKEYQNDLSWQFTLLAGRDESQEKEELKELRGRNVWENFGNSYLYVGKNGKNDLYRIVEAFLGRELTREEEACGISSDLLNSFVGKQIMLSIEPKTSKAGKTFDNIVDYLSVNGELTALTVEEKETARVKKDDDKTSTIQDGQIAPAPEPVIEPVSNSEPIDENLTNVPF